MVKLNGKGFADAFVIFAVVAVLLVGGFVVMRVVNSDDDTSKSSISESKKNSEDDDDASDSAGETEAFSDKELGLSVELSDGWAAEKFDDRTDENPYDSYGFELTSSQDTITMSTSGAGGRGGCSEDEGYTPVPHSSSNKCSTYEIISLQENTNLRDDERVYVVGVKYTEDSIATYIVDIMQREEVLEVGDVLYGPSDSDDEFDYFQVKSTLDGSEMDILEGERFEAISDILMSLERV